MELFTLGRNSIMIRLENIGDIFDSQGEVIYQTIDMDFLTTGLFNLVNRNEVNGFSINSDQVEIVETSLTGNQPYDLMVQNKVQWKTVDDVAKKTVPKSEGVTLQQQRIRVFKVTYNAAEIAFLQ